MLVRDIKKLHRGDQVFWEDLDGGKCSRYYTILEITIKGEVISITDVDGDHLECFARELR